MNVSNVSMYIIHSFLTSTTFCFTKPIDEDVRNWRGCSQATSLCPAFCMLVWLGYPAKEKQWGSCPKFLINYFKCIPQTLYLNFASTTKGLKENVTRVCDGWVLIIYITRKDVCFPWGNFSDTPNLKLMKN